MGEKTRIAWCDFTFNPVWGCNKISAGCRGCYAETWDKRWSGDHWGLNKPRRTFGPKHWASPLQWDKEAAAKGISAKVFCASMTDVFMEDATLEQERPKLWQLIEQTQHLTWLLLTKRPENIMAMLPRDGYWRDKYGRLPANVWIGTSVEDQLTADTRLPQLLRVPAHVRFISHEPLLGPIPFPLQATTGLNGEDEMYQCKRCGAGVWASEERCPNCHSDYTLEWSVSDMIQWVIVGGESGPTARPMHPEWAAQLRDFYLDNGVAFFFKQAGRHLAKQWTCSDAAGAILEEIPPEFQYRQFPAESLD